MQYKLADNSLLTIYRFTKTWRPTEEPQVVRCKVKITKGMFKGEYA